MIRRSFLFLLPAVASLFLLHRLYNARNTDQSLSPATPYVAPPKTDGHFQWRDRKTHYPLTSLTALPTGKPNRLPQIQNRFEKESESEAKQRLEQQNEVKVAFLRCWQSYRSRAWMHDELSPISGGARDTFGGWAATLVDSLDSLWIMDLKDEFNEATRAATQIDFSKSTDDVVNTFETTIRYLGGFLAAYDLSEVKSLLDKAVEVGEMLLVAFDTPNHMPVTRWQWKKAIDGERQEASSGALVSELGSLSLEFTRLSQLTGDQRWYDAIQRITNLFDTQQHSTKIPGLWPVLVNAKDEDLTSDTGFTFGGMSDSLYEYLPKQFALLGGLLPVYQKLYEQAVAAASEHLFFRPLTPENNDILISGDARVSDTDGSITLDPRGQHLTCFAGGMLGLGGRLFSINEHIAMGRKITDGCIWAYRSNTRRVMPEIAHFVPCSPNEGCTWDRQRWLSATVEQNGADVKYNGAADIVNEKSLPEGYTNIDDRRYILRPEAIESLFVMYRITGDRTYRIAAWDMFTAIQNITLTQYANAAIADITSGGNDGLPRKDDRMESFWLAETLKYFYLIFSEPDLISLDSFVLNTEAHPLRRPV